MVDDFLNFNNLVDGDGGSTDFFGVFADGRLGYAEDFGDAGFFEVVFVDEFLGEHGSDGG